MLEYLAIMLLGVPAVGAGISFLLYRFARTRIERDQAAAELVASDARELLPMPGGPERFASRLSEIGGPVATAVRELIPQRTHDLGECARLAEAAARRSTPWWSRTVMALVVIGAAIVLVGVTLGDVGACFGALGVVFAAELTFALDGVQNARQRFCLRLCECLISIDEALRKEGL